MSDRGKMIELAIKWYGLEDWPGESDRVTGLLDRLIEAGFGGVKKEYPEPGYDKGKKCPRCGLYLVPVLGNAVVTKGGHVVRHTCHD